MPRWVVLGLLLAVAAPAVAADPETPAARYAFIPVAAGALRLDTETGEVSLCVVGAQAPSCTRGFGKCPLDARGAGEAQSEDRQDRVAHRRTRSDGSANRRAGAGRTGDGPRKNPLRARDEPFRRRGPRGETRSPGRSSSKQAAHGSAAHCVVFLAARLARCLRGRGRQRKADRNGGDIINPTIAAAGAPTFAQPLDTIAAGTMFCAIRKTRPVKPKPATIPPIAPISLQRRHQSPRTSGANSRRCERQCPLKKVRRLRLPKRNERGALPPRRRSG